MYLLGCKGASGARNGYTICHHYGNQAPLLPQNWPMPREPFNNQYSRQMSVVMWYGIVAPPTQPKCLVTPPTVCVSCALGMHVVKSNLV